AIAAPLVLAIRQPRPTAILGLSTYERCSPGFAVPIEIPAPVATPIPTVAPTARPKAAVATPAAVPTVAPRATPVGFVRSLRGGPTVRAAPDDQSAVLSGLYYDTYLPVYSQQRDAHGTIWYQTVLWGTLPGWIRADQ